MLVFQLESLIQEEIVIVIVKWNSISSLFAIFIEFFSLNFDSNQRLQMRNLGKLALFVFEKRCFFGLFWMLWLIDERIELGLQIAAKFWFFMFASIFNRSPTAGLTNCSVIPPLRSDRSERSGQLLFLYRLPGIVELVGREVVFYPFRLASRSWIRNTQPSLGAGVSDCSAADFLTVFVLLHSVFEHRITFSIYNFLSSSAGVTAVSRPYEMLLSCFLAIL